MENHILARAKEWAQNTYFDQADRQEIQDLLDKGESMSQELTERFYRDLEFGTGGLRSPMGMGQNRMNKYNVRRASQAMANTVKKYFNEENCVAISYDSRHNSKFFAKECAGVFAANGMKAYIFDELTPTPMLSFAVRYYKAKAGVMITASHNPPIYNGFKAFWADGAQVTPPTDKEVIDNYNTLTDWSHVKHMDFEEGVKKGLISWTGDAVNEAFFKVIEDKVVLKTSMIKDEGSKLSVVYTSLHGSGLQPCTRIMNRIGFKNFNIVEEQASFDGSFPTVKSPNPEDPKAMAMAIEKMKKLNADVVYGTDPDGDRLGVVVNHKNEAVIINGNQIGLLMIYYVFKTRTELKNLPKKPLVIKSIVTSPLQDVIVESFGGTVMSTLTGFKWMCDLIRKLEMANSDYEFVFASEESFGYMPQNESRDKDGVSAMVLMSEIALHYKLQGKTLIDALAEIYEQFGFALESLISLDYEGQAGADKINRIMEAFRNYPEKQFTGEAIIMTEDYKSGESVNLQTGAKTKIDLPSSNVLSFTLASGSKFFLRPSGTEPKIKFYTMVRETTGSLKEKEINADKKINLIEARIKEICEKA